MKIDNPFEMLLDKMHSIEVNIEGIKEQLSAIKEQLAANESQPERGQPATRSDAAKHLGVSVGTVDNLVKSKQLKHFRLGASIRFLYDDLDDFIESRKQ